MDASSVGMLSRAASPRRHWVYAQFVCLHAKRPHARNTARILPRTARFQSKSNPNTSKVSSRSPPSLPATVSSLEAPQPLPSGPHSPSRPCSEPRPPRQTGAQRHRFSPHQARLTPELRLTQGAVRTGTTETSQQPRQPPHLLPWPRTRAPKSAQLLRAAGGNVTVAGAGCAHFSRLIWKCGGCLRATRKARKAALVTLPHVLYLSVMDQDDSCRAVRPDGFHMLLVFFDFLLSRGQE